MEDDEDKEEPASLSAPKPAAVPVAQSAIDITAEFLGPLLNSENVANLVRSSNGSSRACASLLLISEPHFTLAHFFCLIQVLISMVYLPDVMPASFQATYTPVESAGTDAQIRHLARLMATQMTSAGIGPGILKINQKNKRKNSILHSVKIF